jgi:tRNA A-37 threonylcarbamoyl transferase component Bud32
MSEGSDPDESTAARTENSSGQRLELPSDLEPGTWISGRYVIVRCIGSGGAGAVYEAEHHSLGRPVAIKLLHPEQLRSATGRMRFEREARAAASINHRHVVAIHDFDTHHGVPYLVMELLRGQTVQQLLAMGGRLPLRRGLELLLGASRGLEALHASGLVHRDLKPGNLFVAQDDGAECCKILDFGITKALEGQNLTASRELLGTPAYMAPERIERPETADQRVDIYALAVTAYEMLTGYSLYGGTPHEVLLRILAGHLPPLSNLTAVMPESLAHLIYRCLSKRPEDRPETAAELSAELERILAELSARPTEELHAGGPELAARIRRRKRPRAVLVALASGTLLGSLLAVWLLLQGQRQQTGPETAASDAPSQALDQLPMVRTEGAAAEAVSTGSVSATPPTPVPDALGPQPAARQRSEALRPAPRRNRVPRTAAGAARGHRRDDAVERSAELLAREPKARVRLDQPAEQPRPSASADSSSPEAASFAPPRFAPPHFVPRASGEQGGAPRAASSSNRQPLAPGHLFQPRPKKED